MTATHMSYESVMDRREGILARATGFSYDDFERPGLGFDDDALLDVVGMDEVEARPPSELARIEAEHARRRGRGVHQPGLAVVARDEVGGVLGQESEVALARAEGLLGALALGDVQ